MYTHPIVFQLGVQSIHLRGHFGFERVIFHLVEFALRHLISAHLFIYLNQTARMRLLTLSPAVDGLNHEEIL